MLAFRQKLNIFVGNIKNVKEAFPNNIYNSIQDIPNISKNSVTAPNITVTSLHKTVIKILERYLLNIFDFKARTAS